MLTIAVNKEKWDKKYRKILSRAAYARRLAVIEGAKKVMQIAYATAPVDTGRFKKNMAQAANAAGVGPLHVIPTKTSRYAETYLERLVSELAYWTRMDEQYQRENRTTYKYYSKILRSKKRAQRELDRFQSVNDAVVIGGLWGNKAPSVRYKSYTGTGRIRQTRTNTLIVVRNTEAHATFVERRTKVMANALKVGAGGMIVRMSKKKYLAALTDGT